MRIDRRGFLELTTSAALAALPAFAFAQESAPMLVTADSVDPLYNDPQIEINEERSDPEPHRYVHGVFRGSPGPGRFSFYFPSRARYQGRFYHNTYPLITDANAGPSPINFKINEGNLGFAFSSGAYFVQTNQGGSLAMRANPDPTISSAYRLNAAAAKLSRMLAAEVYGPGPRPYGYIHGGSGGSFQTMGCAENTRGVWDGFLPYVLGCSYALAGMQGPSAYARYVLTKRNRFPGIVDALDPGGSGDPYADLNDVERAALREATLMGFPLRGWWQYDTQNSGGGNADPAFVNDFWSTPGYAGADPNSPFRQWRVQYETTLSQVTPGSPATVELAGAPEGDLTGARLVVLSGAANGQALPISRVNGRTLTIGGGGGGLVPGMGGGGGNAVANLQPGNRVRLDNSAFLASLTFHRHTLPPSTDFYGWNQFRHPNGEPLYPQRAGPGPALSVSTVGSLLDGQIDGKMLVMECAMDINAYPWQADWYKSKVQAALGREFDDRFAIWFIDNAQHDVPGHFNTEGVEARAWARTINPIGPLQQGLRDLTAWVERDVKPSSTRYEIVDSQIQLPSRARQRRGIQPVVTLQANDHERVEVRVNEPVQFVGTIDTPPNAGKVTAIAWDLEGVGTPDTTREALPTPQARARVSRTHAYTRPGTYFALLRAFSQREGDAETPYAQVQNLARMRVVVR